MWPLVDHRRVSSFPWSNLITAASTLGAGLGTVGLKGRLDRKDRAAAAERDEASARAQRQSAAYNALVASATEMLHNVRQRLDNEYRKNVSPERNAVSPEQEVYLSGRGEAAAAELFRAVADVELAGSEDAGKSAANLRKAALDASGALEYGSTDEAEEALDDFEKAIGAFIDVVRA
jgi:hypothetical protein